jgi:transcriptional regulator with XRE-family HTH domain
MPPLRAGCQDKALSNGGRHAPVELCDSSTGYIGEIESGKRFPSVNMIERIAKALKIESYCLFKNEPIDPSTSNFSIKLAPSQKRAILDKVNTALSKVLDDF